MVQRKVSGRRRRLAAADADRLLKALLVTARAVGETLETRAVEAAADAHLSATKLQLLRLLAQRGGQTATATARFLGVSKPAVSQIVDAMVRAKLVSRRSGTGHDRRELVLELTRDGRRALQAVRRRQRQVLRAAVGLSTAGDTERWIDTLEQVAGALAQADDAFHQFCLQCGAHADGSCILMGGDADCLYLVQTNARAKRHTRTSART
ncbi:MAG: MarR family winged helix-turn-helix transcriptional regulator [Phycisphaerae bacterium]